MRASQWLLCTMKNVTNNTDIVAYKLMLKAGIIRKLCSGIYTWLPTGIKVLSKVQSIIREEMNKIKAIEILMPSMQPSELWKQSGRWKTFGKQLIKIKDSNNRIYCLGPTHEEVITYLIKNEIVSYKQLPINCYQIQTKFRDEIRPRFGIIRTREFLMKDGYSFHLNEECLKKTYDVMYSTYCAIFNRLNLKYRVVEADTGIIGGSISHEFHILSKYGEDIIFCSNNSNYSANIEKAKSLIPKKIDVCPLQSMITVNIPATVKTVDEIINFLKMKKNKFIKIIFVKGHNHPFIALILNYEDKLNIKKANKHPWISYPIQIIDNDIIQKHFHVPIYFIGPINLDIPIIVDYHALSMNTFICGSNKLGKYFINAVWNKNAYYQDSYDLRIVKDGEISPDGLGVLHSYRGIELGHIFQLGTKYTEIMDVKIIDENQKYRNLVMGCYGLGINRIIAAIIEQNHDATGIIWPKEISPFDIVIIPIYKNRSSIVRHISEKIYNKLYNIGYDVLLDDRNKSPGILFYDHDLIGIPHQLIISEKSLQNNLIEYKERLYKRNKIYISINEITKFLENLNLKK